ncbi:hypothetical protein D9M71_695150 [compost metagenome]
MLEIDLDHQDAKQLVAVANFVGEEIAAAFGGCPQAEKLSLLTLDRILVVRAEGEVVADETIGLIPVGGGLGEAVGAHHIDDVGAGALADFCELAVGCRASRFVAGVLEGGLQDGQASENGG